MSSVTIIISMLLVCLAAVVFAAPSLQSPPTSCSAEEHVQMPCVCCKKDCWYTVASAATHELGHMPGEAGEQEAMATLRLIRACMIEECGQSCIARRPF